MLCDAIPIYYKTVQRLKAVVAVEKTKHSDLRTLAHAKRKSLFLCMTQLRCSIGHSQASYLYEAHAEVDPSIPSITHALVLLTPRASTLPTVPNHRKTILQVLEIMVHLFVWGIGR